MISINAELQTRKHPHRAALIPPPWPYDASALEALERTVVRAEIRHREDPETTRPCVIRFLNSEHLDELVELNDVVLEHLPHPHILRAASREEFAEHMTRRGRCIGAFADGRMVAFTVLSCPRDEPDNLGLDLGFDRDRRMRSCHLELSGVHPLYRGSRLHRTMNAMRANFAGAAGFHYLFGTVSPLNPYSLANHLAQGMTIRKLVTKYGGMDRYIIHRHYHERFIPPHTMTGAKYRRCFDTAGQKLLLDKGYWGIGLRRTESIGWEVAYVPSASVRFETAGMVA